MLYAAILSAGLTKDVLVGRSEEKQAPGRAKYPEYKSSDLCDGCISLSNAEGFDGIGLSADTLDFVFI